MSRNWTTFEQRRRQKKNRAAQLQWESHRANLAIPSMLLAARRISHRDTGDTNEFTGDQNDAALQPHTLPRRRSKLEPQLIGKIREEPLTWTGSHVPGKQAPPDTVTDEANANVSELPTPRDLPAHTTGTQLARETLSFLPTHTHSEGTK